MKIIRTMVVCLLSLSVINCSGFFDTDNIPPPSPLTHFTPQIHVHPLWYTRTGFGAGEEYLKLNAAVGPSYLFVAEKNGLVTALDKLSGKTVWSVSTGFSITSGLIANDGDVFFGTRKGQVVALCQDSGKILWVAETSSEILAPPAVSGSYVVSKSIDGVITAVNRLDGHLLWHFKQPEPTLILRGSSSAQVKNDAVVAGFANGTLSKLTLQAGNLIWHQAVAMPHGSFAVQRMVDIDADPIIFGNRVYVATYQGSITALELSTGNKVWEHEISTYTGMTADNAHIFLTDEEGMVWAFDTLNGTVLWRQNSLQWRNLTAPLIMNNYIVVGDGKGYLHWLCKQDGHFVARVKVNYLGILANPVVDNDIVYVVTRDGHVAAYSI